MREKIFSRSVKVPLFHAAGSAIRREYGGKRGLLMKKVKIPRGRLLGVHCSIAGGVANAPLAGAEIGCTAIQLFTGSNQQWRAKPILRADAALFRENVEAGGIRVAFAHAMYLINLAAPDAEIFKKSVKAMAGELSRADVLGLPFVIVHPGAPKERGAAWGMRRAAEAIGRVFDLVPDAKAKIALETTAGAGSSLGRTFGEIASIIDASDTPGRLLTCFDTCHAFAAGYDFRTGQGYEEMWRSFDGAIGIENLAAIHLNDCLGDCASRLDRHTHIGKGRIGLEGFRLIMNDRRLTGIPMVLETPKGDSPHREDSRNLNSLIKLIS